MFNLADDEEEYDEESGGNRLLGFMFGNVDNAGDLDVDYLDEVSSSSPLSLIYSITIHVNEVILS